MVTLLQRYLKPLVFSILLSACLYAVMIFISGTEDIKPALEKVRIPALALIFSLSLANYFIRFIRWNMYSKKLGHYLPVTKHILYYFSGFSLTTTPGKAGEAIRHIYLKPHGVPLRHSLAALFAERLSDLMAMCLLAGLATVHFSEYRSVELIIAICIFSLILLLQSRKAIDNVHQKLSGIAGARFHSLLEKVFKLLHSSSSLLQSRILFSGLVMGVLSWGCEGFAFYYLLQVLEIPVSLWLGIGIYAISVLIGALSFLPGGLGGTEAVMGLLLVAVGASPADAILATLICRLATLWFAVVLGLLVVLWLEYREPRLTAASG